jgi:hypothetical protein
MMSLNGIILEMYEEVMYSIEKNLFEERLNSKESFRKAIALWKNLPEGKKEAEAKRILKASKREGYIVKQKDILKYADKIEDFNKIKAKKAVRKQVKAKKKAKREEKFEKIKLTVEYKDLENKTRIELLALATKKGMKITPKMNREELLNLLKPKKEVEVENNSFDLKFEEFEPENGTDKQKSWCKKIRLEAKNRIEKNIEELKRIEKVMSTTENIKDEELRIKLLQEFDKIKKIYSKKINSKNCENIINNKGSLGDSLPTILNSNDIKSSLKKFILQLNDDLMIDDLFDKDLKDDEFIVPKESKSKKIDLIKDVNGKEYSGYWNGKIYNSKQDETYRIYVGNSEVVANIEEIKKIVENNNDFVDKLKKEIIDEIGVEENEFDDVKWNDEQKQYIQKVLNKVNRKTYDEFYKLTKQSPYSFVVYIKNRVKRLDIDYNKGGRLEM